MIIDGNDWPGFPLPEERLVLSRPRTITGEFHFKNRTEYTRTVQLMMGVTPSFKYGERCWS